MDIGNASFTTPFERPFAYDADWRHQLSLACAAEKIQSPISRDRWVTADLHYLSSMRTPGLLTARGTDADVRAVNEIYQTRNSVCLKDKLDALLLCEGLTIPVIATLTGLSQNQVTAYERIFFNVRDDKGRLCISMWAREYFVHGGNVPDNDAAMGDRPLYWRTLALTGGHKPLLAAWGWLPPHELPEAEVNLMVFRNLLINLDWRIRYGKIDAKSCMDMLGRMKEIVDDMRSRGVIAGTGDASSEVSAVFKLLYEVRPKAPVVTEKLLEKYDSDLQVSLAAIQERFAKAGNSGGSPSRSSSASTGD